MRIWVCPIQRGGGVHAYPQPWLPVVSLPQNRPSVDELCDFGARIALHHRRIPINAEWCIMQTLGEIRGVGPTGNRMQLACGVVQLGVYDAVFSHLNSLFLCHGEGGDGRRARTYFRRVPRPLRGRARVFALRLDLTFRVYHIFTSNFFHLAPNPFLRACGVGEKVRYFPLRCVVCRKGRRQFRRPRWAGVAIRAPLMFNMRRSNRVYPLDEFAAVINFRSI